MDSSKPHSQFVSEHLANERTYLAWLRTSFSLLTLGFATNKFGQFLAEIHMKSGDEGHYNFLNGSRRFGLMMVVLGTVLMATSSWHYQRTKRGIDSGDFRPTTILIWIVSGMSICFGITAVFLLFQT